MSPSGQRHKTLMLWSGAEESRKSESYFGDWNSGFFVFKHTNDLNGQGIK